MSAAVTGSRRARTTAGPRRPSCAPRPATLPIHEADGARGNGLGRRDSGSMCRPDCGQRRWWQRGRCDVLHRPPGCARRSRVHEQRGLHDVHHGRRVSGRLSRGVRRHGHQHVGCGAVHRDDRVVPDERCLRTLRAVWLGDVYWRAVHAMPLARSDGGMRWRCRRKRGGRRVSLPRRTTTPRGQSSRGS